MTLLLDYAWQKPTTATIKAAGYSGVMRYLSPDLSKNLSPSERDQLLAAGLSIGLVWESTSNRAGQGSAAGAVDARAAQAQAAALGYPARCPIFYAVDYDAAPSAVVAYFAGITSAATRPVGVYGSYRVVEAATCPYRWQACAWSAGKVSAKAHLYQRLHASVAHPIASTDENLLVTPFPLWTNTLTPTPPPPEVDMPLTPADIKAVVDAILTARLGRSNQNVAQALQNAGSISNTDVTAIAAAVLAGLPTGAAGGVTVEALAKAVNDDAARRLVS